jgi:rhodanese-related sulfurtransferase
LASWQRGWRSRGSARSRAPGRTSWWPNGAVLVDVRREAEFADGHLPGATHVPLGNLSARASALAAERKPIVVYLCSVLLGDAALY